MNTYKKQYCRYCGSLLLQTPWYGSYDNDTGERYESIEYRCPEKKWWQFWHELFPSPCM